MNPATTFLSKRIVMNILYSKSSKERIFSQSAQEQRLKLWFLLICGSIAKLLGFLDCVSKKLS
jgi:hypothetical protein